MISWKSIWAIDVLPARRAVRVCVVAVVALSVSACGWLAGAVVTIENVGVHPLDQIRLEVGGGIIEIESIAAGEKLLIKPDIKGDSSLRINYRDNEENVVCDGDVYFTNNLRVRVEVEIGGGVCHVVDVTD
ncbi:hypothetical protein [Stenotrophomonas sp. PD6]|uniref:hypothetical protein n=1 Tax=Stenotrophomonas sp. PD6 TaxID=3368612 RepID=UPI003B9F608D